MKTRNEERCSDVKERHSNRIARENSRRVEGGGVSFEREKGDKMIIGKFGDCSRQGWERQEERKRTKSESRRLWHLMKKRRTEKPPTAAEFVEENRGEDEGGESNRRRWANIAVQRDEGEPRCR